MILPFDLTEQCLSALQSFSSTLSKLEQLTLKAYIEQGYYRKHLKKTYKQSKKKNDFLTTVFKSLEDERFNILGLESNMHFIIQAQNLYPYKTLLKSLDYQYKKLDDTKIIVPYSGLDMDELKTLATRINSL